MMKAIKLGNVEFTENVESSNPFIIGVFGPEGSGKTRLPLTGPDSFNVIGFVPLERKSYATIKKDAAILGKRVWTPKDPDTLIVNMRKASLLAAPDLANAKTDKAIKDAEDDANDKVREYYRSKVDAIYGAVYAMLEHPEVDLVVIDTFTQFYGVVNCAHYGFKTKYMKIKDKTFQDHRECNQEIIDFLNSVPQYNKHVILTHRERDEYDNELNKATGRKVWEGFKYLGNYTNLLIHLESNPKWKSGSSDPTRKWHFAASIRTCQNNIDLEGDDGFRMLKDDDVTLETLLSMVDPEFGL